MRRGELLQSHRRKYVGAMLGAKFGAILWKRFIRLVYGVQDDILMVMVMAADRREDSAVYQSAMARISELISELAKVTPKRH